MSSRESVQFCTDWEWWIHILFAHYWFHPINTQYFLISTHLWMFFKFHMLPLICTHSYTFPVEWLSWSSKKVTITENIITIMSLQLFIYRISSHFNSLMAVLIQFDLECVAILRTYVALVWLILRMGSSIWLENCNTYMNKYIKYLVK